MNDKQIQSTRLQRTIAMVLTVIFLAVLFASGIYAAIPNLRLVARSLRTWKAESYLTDPNDRSFFAMMAARFASLRDYLGKKIPLTDEYGYLNAGFQRTLGKDLVTQGSEQLLYLPSGQIYGMTTRQSLQAEAQEIVNFYEQLNGEVPFLFAFISPQFYEGGEQLPAGYDTIDTGDELADEVLSIIRGAGIDALDSREFFTNTTYATDDLQLRTDLHWTTLAALLATPTYVDEINRLTGRNLDASLLEPSQFETQTYPGLFLGEYAQQVGEMNAGTDDITLYWPKYETSFTRHTVDRDGTVYDVQGSYKDAIIRWNCLDLEEDGTNVRAYAAYGLVEGLEEITNLGACEDMTLLIFRDSYTAPIGTFLSLLVKNVVMVDMREADRPAIDYVKQYNPDMVICSLSRQMLEKHNYDLGAEAGEGT